MRILMGNESPSAITNMNEPLREALLTQSECLVVPARDFCLLFTRDPKSMIFAPRVFNQLWYYTEESIQTN
tara:strand:- start:176 stop:388 length:213 start_codon:yes stop_codon:yes gene_type:complete